MTAGIRGRKPQIIKCKDCGAKMICMKKTKDGSRCWECDKKFREKRYLKNFDIDVLAEPERI